MPLAVRATVLAVVAALLPQACLAGTDCRMRDALATLKQEQCDFCEDASDSVCQGGGVGPAAKAVHDNCDWTLAHGCRASKRISHFSDLLSASESFANAKRLLDLGKQCSLHLDEADCGNASVCVWENGVIDQGAEVDMLKKLRASGTTSNCILQENLFLLLLISVVDGTTPAGVDHIIDSQTACSAAGGADCATLNDNFLASGDYSQQLPCEYNEDTAECEIAIDLIFLKIAKISEQPDYIEAAEDALRCSSVKEGDSCALSKVTGCEANEDGECELPESTIRGYGSDVINSYFLKKDTCEAISTKANCEQAQAQSSCAWNTDDAECALPQDAHGIGFAINHASGYKLDYVENFMKDLDQCDEVMENCVNAPDCYDKCSAAGCEWVPGITCGLNEKGCGSTMGFGDLKGACAPHVGGVIPPAVSDQRACATALSDAIHAAVACETHVLEADCTNNRNHPDYKCFWNCGMCIPDEQYFPIAVVEESYDNNSNTTAGPLENSAGAATVVSAVLANAFAMAAIFL